MKKVFCWLLVMTMLFLFTGSAMAEAMTDGHYSATAAGNNGDLTVSVTIDQGAITKVEVTAHSETAGISDSAFERIPAAIVEGQTLAVDAVSGATNTSNAILAAVSDCVVQAGGDPAQMSGADETAAQDLEQVELTADVVVVGGGIAGVSAALAAADEGANVVLFEKQAFLGGSAATAGGNFAVVGSQYEIDAGFDPSVENALGRLRARAEADAKQSGYPDYDRLTKVLTDAADNITWLESQGMIFGDIMEPGTELARLRTRIPDGTNNGAQMMKTLSETLYEKGVTVYTECPVVELILEGGKAVGVMAQGAGKAVTAHANGGVVLACGGFAQNQAMMEELVPEYAGEKCTSAVGNTGDGFAMAKAAGAAFYDNPWVIAAAPSVSPQVTNGPAIAYQAGILVDKAGQRLINEASQYSVVSNTIAWNPEVMFLYDSTNADAALALEEAVTLGEAFKGDTLEELAAAAGIDAAALAETVLAYNGYAASGEDQQFGKAAASLIALENAPFYAVKMYPAYMGTLGGVITNDDAQVLDAQNQAIPGLYAAGEMSNRCYYNYGYYSAASLQIYSQMAHAAGRHAALQAKG